MGGGGESEEEKQKQTNKNHGSSKYHVMDNLKSTKQKVNSSSKTKKQRNKKPQRPPLFACLVLVFLYWYLSARWVTTTCVMDRTKIAGRFLGPGLQIIGCTNVLNKQPVVVSLNRCIHRIDYINACNLNLMDIPSTKNYDCPSRCFTVHNIRFDIRVSPNTSQGVETLLDDIFGDF